ncbi:formyltetrahydrofolate deformylase [Opitutaceae bacterium TAV4]|uniref:formyltetrahydrofolate deformylase n=1 Tax=Geminisphaera colitermitum TaxID=1148786 RepID=UPI0001964E89|nr:formyltetrahydrofolate deformylase [Geminisphaera colitermitum]RRJ96302.1 formyltetrahydrofolate deformylase [Opitutaceae bacterium TAV4]RRK00420.1 formyltetrahydrofolate deformylase [Opitutaceae bacterium TAV3]
MNPPNSSLVALLHGPDQPGLVARVSGWIFEKGGNILHADQHQDREAGVFFQRVEWVPLAADGREAEAERLAFAEFARGLGMNVQVVCRAQRSRVAMFVSKFDHCFHDIALRWRAGEFDCDFVAVISNHPDLAAAAEGYGLPYYHIPVSAATKAEAEARQVALLRELRADLVIMARYMQVLSADFLGPNGFGRPVINIHHSFLPAFAGGKPYHQAHARGVKLIGATAHYATAVLDDGPIIHQDVTRVTHRHGVDDLIRMGRDLERLVLARAVRLHLNQRVLAYGNKTVVFD